MSSHPSRQQGRTFAPAPEQNPWGRHARRAPAGAIPMAPAGTSPTAPAPTSSTGPTTYTRAQVEEKLNQFLIDIDIESMIEAAKQQVNSTTDPTKRLELANRMNKAMLMIYGDD